jgi:hypothetical protein
LLFHVHHIHTKETCPAVHPEMRERVARWWTNLKDNPDVTVVSCYVSPSDHNFYIALDAASNTAMAKAIAPLNALGTGNTSPVVSIEDMLGP